MATATQDVATLSHSFATSADGTKLSYYSIGQGPSMLVLHGAVCFALSHQELAVALSPYYTVHTASRRERGLSGPYPSAVTEPNPYPEKEENLYVGQKTYKRCYSPAFAAAVLSTEIADLEALVTATKAEYIVCVSSGALIVLHALLPSNLHALPGLSSLKAVAIFEPPLSCTDRDSLADLSLLPRFEAEMAAGDEAAAMVTAMQAVQLGPAWIPRWLMKQLSSMMMRGQDKSVAKEKEKSGEDKGRCTMRELGRALRYDFAVSEGMIGDSARFATVGEREGGEKVKLMLLSGTKSPRYLQGAVAVLGEVIPSAKSVAIPGVGHEVLCGAEMRGQPGKAVPTIRAFFDC